jgi:hypothetical protein
VRDRFDRERLLPTIAGALGDARLIAPAQRSRTETVLIPQAEAA